MSAVPWSRRRIQSLKVAQTLRDGATNIHRREFGGLRGAAEGFERIGAFQLFFRSQISGKDPKRNRRLRDSSRSQIQMRARRRTREAGNRDNNRSTSKPVADCEEGKLAGAQQRPKRAELWRSRIVQGLSERVAIVLAPTTHGKVVSATPRVQPVFCAVQAWR